MTVLGLMGAYCLARRLGAGALFRSARDLLRAQPMVVRSNRAGPDLPLVSSASAGRLSVLEVSAPSAPGRRPLLRVFAALHHPRAADQLLGRDRLPGHRGEGDLAAGRADDRAAAGVVGCRRCGQRVLHLFDAGGSSSSTPAGTSRWSISGSTSGRFCITRPTSVSSTRCGCRVFITRRSRGSRSSSCSDARSCRCCCSDCCSWCAGRRCARRSIWVWRSRCSGCGSSTASRSRPQRTRGFTSRFRGCARSSSRITFRRSSFSERSSCWRPRSVSAFARTAARAASRYGFWRSAASCRSCRSRAARRGCRRPVSRDSTARFRKRTCRATRSGCRLTAACSTAGRRTRSTDSRRSTRRRMRSVRRWPKRSRRERCACSLVWPERF